MNCLYIRDLFPRPIRELVFGAYDIQLFRQQIGKNQTAQLLSSETNEQAFAKVQIMIRSLLHTALFVSGFCFAHYFGWGVFTTGVLGVILSPASMMIGLGFFGLSYGARSLLYSIGTGAFFHFATGIVSVSTSYYTLENLEFFQVGFLERLVKQIAQSGACYFMKNV